MPLLILLNSSICSQSVVATQQWSDKIRLYTDKC
jgi:hypothetical protein